MIQSSFERTYHCKFSQWPYWIGFDRPTLNKHGLRRKPQLAIFPPSGNSHDFLTRWFWRRPVLAFCTKLTYGANGKTNVYWILCIDAAGSLIDKARVPRTAFNTPTVSSNSHLFHSLFKRNQVSHGLRLMWCFFSFSTALYIFSKKYVDFEFWHCSKKGE